MVTPAPNPECVSNVAALLSGMSPPAAGDAIMVVMAGIADGLSARGWQQNRAERFACDFGRQVARHIARMARPTLH